MESIAAVLKWVFTYILYPGLIIGIFLFIIGSIYFMYERTFNVRILLAAILPIVLLLFIVVSDANMQMVKNVLELTPIWALILTGTIIGAVIVEFGKSAGESANPVTGALYSLFLSLVGVFILFCIMSTSIQVVHHLLFALVISGGFYAIFRGIPGVSETRI